VREDESGDSEDGKDDELPCVIEAEGEGDCIWRGSRSSVVGLRCTCVRTRACVQAWSRWKSVNTTVSYKALVGISPNLQLQCSWGQRYSNWL